MYFSLPRYSFIEPCKVFLFAFFFIMFLNLAAAPLSFSQIVNKNKMKCNCVIFRLDDVQDNYHDQSQLALMNFFLEKNQSLSLGLIANAFGNDSIVLNEVRTGFDAGKFELASHGWNHENFSKLSEHDQMDLLNKSNERIYKLFGIRPTTFIPPDFDFNNATLDAMRQLGIKIISSDHWFYSDRNQSHLVTNIRLSNYTANDRIFHFPNTVEYSDFVLNKSKTPPVDQWNTLPIEKLLDRISNSISTHGYAVVTIHPQEFAITQNGELTNALNVTELGKLKKLVDTIMARDLRVITFNKLNTLPSDLVNSTALS
jgi:peptidoglycan/xylan/chitin deacetylase (PgdA/CDA1 family)